MSIPIPRNYSRERGLSDDYIDKYFGWAIWPFDVQCKLYHDKKTMTDTDFLDTTERGGGDGELWV